MSSLVPMMRVPVRPDGLKKWNENPTGGMDHARLVRAMGLPEDEARWYENARWFKRGPLAVCVNLEPVFPERRLSWHLSISHRSRYPTWDEIRDARYDLIPHDVWMVQVLPPPEEYVNAHENTFHLWQSWEAADRPRKS